MSLFCTYTILTVFFCFIKSTKAFENNITDNFPSDNHDYPLAIIMMPVDKKLSFNKALMIPAFEIALETIKKWNIHPTIQKLQFYADADSDCESTRLPLYYTVKLLMKSKPNVWFGPTCDYSLAPIARLLPFWNIPIITPGGASSTFRRMKHIEYRTLTRVGHFIVTDHLKFLFRKIFSKYNWTKVKYFYEYTFLNYCRSIGTMFDDEKVSKEKTFKSVTHVNNETLHEIEMGAEHAIIVLCVEPETIRQILLRAHKLNFINGEYVFININLIGSEANIRTPWFSKNDSEENNKKAREAYRALLTITAHKPESAAYHEFLKKVKDRSNETGSEITVEESNSYLGVFHDSLLLYALGLNDTMAMNKSFENGDIITRNMWNRSFTGISGQVSIDDNGDRYADYSVLDMDKETGIFKVVANYIGNKQMYQPVKGQTIDWVNTKNLPPPSFPVCGYNRKNCPNRKIGNWTISLITMSAIFTIALICGIFIYRRAKFQAELNAMNWIIPWEAIETKEKRHRRTHKISDPVPNSELISKRFLYSKRGLAKSDEESDVLIGNPSLAAELTKSRPSRANSINVSINSWESFTGIQNDNLHCIKLFITTALYKGNVVALKELHGTKKVEINRNLLIEVKKVKNLNNEHVCRFIGVCLDAPQHWLLTEYCPKGSLQDILENEQINLDWMFKFSLLQDICRGMIYLHSNIGPHGNLKSSNCLVDSRFVLKICDFGLEKLRGTKEYLLENDEYAYYRNLLWTAPEILRDLTEIHQNKSIKADVYSFGIICQEVVYRNGVFYLSDINLEPKKIIETVRKIQVVAFRPFLSENEICSEGFCRIIRLSWQEDFSLRPDFRTIKGMMRCLNKGGDSGNILDNLLSRMEQYANNLEELVNQRTEQYLEEKRKTEDLLYSMLPKSVAGQLIRNETVTAESYEMVSIYFSDIVGFTALSAESTPMQVIELLNRLYTTFDSIIESFDVYKVETIGDAYMVCSGLPQRNGDIHIREIARMSLAFLSAIFEFQIPHKPNKRVELRIGIHSGPVCAGVVGLKMPRYCLFGDTVNTASRMESNGLPLKIHMSEQSVEVLRTFQRFIISKRGQVNMKGKGFQTTYWLHGEDSVIVDPIPENCEFLKL